MINHDFISFSAVQIYELHIYGKTLENVYVCNDHFTRDCYEVSYRYDLLGAKTRKRNSGSLLLQFLAPLKFKQTIENSSFVVI